MSVFAPDYGKRGVAGWTGNYASAFFGDLISSTSAGEAINQLLVNTGIAKSVICSKGKCYMHSNPFGTCIFLLSGGDEFNQDPWIDQIGVDGIESSDVSYTPPGMPGYVGSRSFERFLAGPCVEKAEKMSPGTLIALYWKGPHSQPGEGPRLRHSSVCIGSRDGHSYFFHQRSEGGEFGVDTIEDFRRGMCEDIRKSMETRLFRFTGRKQ